MTRAAHLGGSDRTYAHASVPIAQAVVIDHYREPLSLHWRMKVKLEGGKVISGVQVLTQSDGNTTGTRPKLPGKGVTGMVMWPAFTRNSRKVIWLGSLDSYFDSVEQDDHSLDVTLRPNGYGTALDKESNSTTRWPGGDNFFFGQMHTEPHQFKIREIDGDERSRIKPLSERDRRGRVIDRINNRFKAVLNGVKRVELIEILMRDRLSWLRADAIKAEFEIRINKFTPIPPNLTERGWFRAHIGDMVSVGTERLEGVEMESILGVDGEVPAWSRVDLSIPPKKPRIHLHTHMAALDINTRNATFDIKHLRVGGQEGGLNPTITAPVASAPRVMRNAQKLVKRDDELDQRLRALEALLGIQGAPLADGMMEPVASLNLEAEGS